MKIAEEQRPQMPRSSRNSDAAFIEARITRRRASQSRDLCRLRLFGWGEVSRSPALIDRIHVGPPSL
jgi:hypothetical protein